jgi:hypothetical protein
MRIWVKENNKVKFWLWLPSWIWIMNEVLRHAAIEGAKLSRVQRKKIISAIKLSKKNSKYIADINIQSHDGIQITIKI